MAGRIFDGFAGGVMAKGGAKMTQRIEVANGAVKPSLSVGWAHEFTNPHTTVREVRRHPRQRLHPDRRQHRQRPGVAGRRGQLRDDAALVGLRRYDAALGRRATDHAVSAGFRMTW
jgi:hypothetical protein